MKFVQVCRRRTRQGALDKTLQHMRPTKRGIQKNPSAKPPTTVKPKLNRSIFTSPSHSVRSDNISHVSRYHRNANNPPIEINRAPIRNNKVPLSDGASYPRLVCVLVSLETAFAGAVLSVRGGAALVLTNPPAEYDDDTHYQ